MNDQGTGNERPRLAYVYHPGATPAFTMAEAARDLCDLIWVLDVSDPAVGRMPRMLARLGTVVDIGGLDRSEAAEALGAAEPDGILTQSDSLLDWTADVGRRLGLKVHTPRAARGLTDKFVQRAALKAGGLQTPGCWTLSSATTEEEWDRLEHEASFPCVLKPRQGAGSMDTEPMSSMTDVRRIVLDPAVIERAPDREWVLEEYIPDAPDGTGGDGFAGYVSVESVVSGGRVVHLAVTGRTPPAKPFRETGFFIPSGLDSTQTAAVLRVAGDAAHALDVTTGSLHTEIKLTPTGPVVIEVNGRMGGGIPEILQSSTGVRMRDLAIRIAVGLPIDIAPMPKSDRLGYLLYMHAPDGIRRVESIDGLDAVRTYPGVDELVMNLPADRSVDWRRGNDGHAYSVTGTTADHDGLRRLLAHIASTVSIVGE